MDADQGFRAVWAAFGDACSETVAPEATYQAWFAHFLMQKFDVLRVVREVDFGARHLLEDDVTRFSGTNLMLDVMVLREPVVNLPRRAWLGPPGLTATPNPRSGLGRLDQFEIISELKVGATQGGGLDATEVLRDVHKLDAILRAAARDHPEMPLPRAYACVLDNNVNHKMNRANVARRLKDELPKTPVSMLIYPE